MSFFVWKRFGGIHMVLLGFIEGCFKTKKLISAKITSSLPFENIIKTLLFYFSKLCFLSRSFLLLACLLISTNCIAVDREENNYIVVNKKNVIHKFVRFDRETDHFTSNIFQNWENEKFNVFDKVKDNRGIAIDIGAWIGTTSIWLAKNFYHVVSIECDKESLICLEKNLTASECKNVTICDKAISNTSEKIIFGPIGNRLNESTSCIKTHSNNENDYVMRSATFKQIIYDYIYSNEKINSHRISFIKCDIEGEEENILEDLLHFAYYNNCSVYVSFHLDRWKSKKITDFEYLFKYFKTNHSVHDLPQYIAQNPFTSILFEPINNAGLLIKKNIPSLIIGYNQYTFIKNMVQQLEKYTSDITVIDNNSNYQPLLDYYQNDFKYTLLKQKSNFGYTVYNQDRVQKLVGDLYVLTDPDLQFNPHLPDNFLSELINISNYFGASRVGFALFIDSDDIRTDITYSGQPIKSWESQFWKQRLIYPLNETIELYSAPIDTTFCLINKRCHNPAIRVAGEYSCFHIPWHKNFEENLEKGEYEYYLKNNNSTHWFGKSQ